MIRIFDFIISFLLLFFLLPILISLYFIGLLSNGSPLFKQNRVGYNQKIFLLVKFRTMKINTKSVATHLLDTSMITPFGHLLRSSKLDELPQLFNVLLGHMSLVGPRPCLPNQKRLIIERKKRHIFSVKPGITGLAQISGIDMKDPILLAKTDLRMIKNMNLYYYFYYLFKTIIFIMKKKS